MTRFEKVQTGLYRLRVPFENIFTSVFCIETSTGRILVDSASGVHDVEAHILPALELLGEELGRSPISIDMILCTHAHGDHVGGLAALHAQFPEAQICAFGEGVRACVPDASIHILSDGEVLQDCIQALHLPGHSKDSAGFLDLRTRTLISGDSIQFFGVGRYGCAAGLWSAYQASLDRLLQMDIAAIVASHDYVPIGGIAFGKDEVRAFLMGGFACMWQIRSFVRTECMLGHTDPKEIAQAFDEEIGRLRAYPPLAAVTVRGVMQDEGWDRPLTGIEK